MKTEIQKIVSQLSIRLMTINQLLEEIEELKNELKKISDKI